MKKSDSILVKAINEAETIRAGALKNANELLFDMFQPKMKNIINQSINESLMSEPENVTSDFDQDSSEANTENPGDTINTGGHGAPLLEADDDLEDPEDVVEEGDEVGDEDDEISEDIDIEDDEEISEDFVSEQDIDLDDEDDITEDFNSLDDDDIVEIDDELLDDEMSEQVMDDDEDEEVIEQFGDEDDIDEDFGVNTSNAPAFNTAANEGKNYRKLKIENRNLRISNKRLKNESLKSVKGFNILRRKLAEVNLFNQKLSYAIKAINNQKSLTPSDKKSIIEQFDKCTNLREVKMTYNFMNKFKNRNVSSKKSSMNESTKKMLTKINNNKTNSNNSNDGSFNARTLRMAGLDD